MKICSRCAVEKPLSDYQKQAVKKDGLMPHCRACQAIASAKHRAENKEKIAAAKKEYAQRNKEILAVKSKAYRDANAEKLRLKTLAYNARPEVKEMRRAHAKANAEQIAKRDKAYREKHKEHIRARHAAHRRKIRPKINEYQTRRYSEDPLFRLRVTYRTRILDAMRRGGYTKRSKTSSLLGCNLETFKAHLESKFIPGMTWQNRGRYGWHVDHIIPLASAKTQEDIERLCHYTNTQPLWVQDNHSKGCKIL